jgi:hypothetical protein
MWNINSLWFEVSIVSITFLLGHIFLGHFEERAPKIKKLAKYIVTLFAVVLLSAYFGRTAALTIYGIMFIPVLYIHGIWLPKKGINGWTGEPRDKYYELRGWDKDVVVMKRPKDEQ